MKKIKIIFSYIVFIVLVIESGYLYSIRWDFVPWGSSLRDGLFFLAFYTIIIPLLVATAVFKRSLMRNSNQSFIRNSFFVYSLAIILPSIDTSGSQASLGLGVIVSGIISVCTLLEFFKLYKISVRR